MTGAILIDGRAAAEGLRARVAAVVGRMRAEGIVPGLAVVLVGEDAASAVYVRNKDRATREAGMAGATHRLPADASGADLMALIAALNADPAVHGILCQLPLPPQIDADAVLAAIDPAKDVDGFHVANVGLLATGGRALVPCTPMGCMMLLRAHLGSLAGREAVVLGRSNIVGKPMAQLLLAAHATVTVAHSRSRDVAAVARRADVVVAAMGRPEIVTGDWLKPGATVIDVGISRVPDGAGGTRLAGDCAFDSCAAVAGAITPVPGGVGPMTIACLLVNTLTACCRAHGLPEPEGLGA